MTSETPEPPSPIFIFPPTLNREVSPLVRDGRYYPKPLLLFGTWPIGFSIGPTPLLKRPISRKKKKDQFRKY